MAANDFDKNKSPFGRQNQALYIGIFLTIVLLGLIAMNRFYPRVKNVTYSDFLGYVSDLKVTKVMITGQDINGVFSTPVDGYVNFETIIPLSDNTLLPLLKTNHVQIEGREMRDPSASIIWVIVIVVAILLVVWLFIMRGIQGGAGGGDSARGAMQFGKSRARLHRDIKKKVKFSDVAGCEEAKEDLKEVVEFLKSPQKFTALGARIPKGVLLVGSPGTGKTLLAKAVAGEADVPFFSVSGSEFVEMFVGVGASRVRDLFAQGRKNAPCIIFIDELDAVGRSRGTGLGGSHDEREQTLNQILVEMDGFDSSEGLILVAATNRPDILDAALMRPGRFDRQIVVDKPDVRAREMILKVHTRKTPLEEGIDLSIVAKATPGLTGADLENLVNEAALKAARENRKKLSFEDLEFAREKVQMGPERRSRVILEEDKVVTAYHESGHAVMSHVLPLTDPVHKVTIIPRGFANGYTMPLPVDERSHAYKERLLEDLMVYLGGRAAEELVFGKAWISAGASHDIQEATKLAHSMVCEWGMSDVLGPVQYGENEGPVFLGKDLVTRKNFSEKIHETIDSEVVSMISTAYEKTKALLKKYRKKLDAMAKALLDRETLDGSDVSEILGDIAKDRFPILKALGMEPTQS